jgi:hypothetical protein
LQVAPAVVSVDRAKRRPIVRSAGRAVANKPDAAAFAGVAANAGATNEPEPKTTQSINVNYSEDLIVGALSVDRAGAPTITPDTTALAGDHFHRVIQQTQAQNPGDIDPVWVGNQVKSYMQAGNYDRAVQFVLDYAKTTIDPLDYARTVSDADFNKMLSQFPVSTLLAHAGANEADLLKAIVQKGDASQITALTQQMPDDPLLAQTMAQYGTSANKFAYVEAIAQSPGSNSSLDNAALVISTMQGPDALTAMDSFSEDQIRTMFVTDANPVYVGNKVKSYMQAGKYEVAAQTVIDYGQNSSDDDFQKMDLQFSVPDLVQHTSANKRQDLLHMINLKDPLMPVVYPGPDFGD